MKTRNTTEEFFSALSRNSSPVLVRVLNEKDLGYLSKAYDAVEGYWQDQFRQFRPQTIRLVLLSEAPLFGDRETYIYNPNVGVTSFFNYKNYAEVFGSYGPPLPSSGSAKDRKQALLAALRQLGVLILDLFPFSLNKETALNYSKLTAAERTELFLATASYHFSRKMKYVLEKTTPRTLFVFRYCRVRDACVALVRSEMARLGINPDRVVLSSVSGRRGVLLPERLRGLYEQTIP